MTTKPKKPTRAAIVATLAELDRTAPPNAATAEPTYHLEAVTDLVRSLRRGDLVLLSRRMLRAVIRELRGTDERTTRATAQTDTRRAGKSNNATPGRATTRRPGRRPGRASG